MEWKILRKVAYLMVHLLFGSDNGIFITKKLCCVKFIDTYEDRNIYKIKWALKHY